MKRRWSPIPAGSASPPRVVAATSAVAVLLVTAGCGAGADATSTKVQILWLGTSDGRPAYGVTDAEVATSRPSEAGFAVDMSAAGRTGEQWQTAAWTAATVGSMLSGADPRGVTVSYKVGESIDGPSAGAVLAAAVLTDLRGSGSLPQNVTMTGTVLPSGALGPVGGIPAKLRAAAEAGIDTVLVPPGQAIAVDPTTGRQVVIDDLAAELGVAVEPVASVQEALEFFGAGLDAPDAPTDPASFPLDSELSALFTEEANLALQRLQALPIAAVPEAGDALSDTKALEVERQRITSGVALAQTRVGALLAEGRVIDAFARATLAEREVLAWNAQALTAQQASADPAATSAAISSSAGELASDADAQIDATVTSAAKWPLAYAEQLTALPDALSWATDAWAAARVVEAASTGGAKPSDLATAAGLLAASRYDVEVYLPVSARLAREVGRTPIADPTAATEILSTYAELLADTGEAVSGDEARGRAGAAETSAGPAESPGSPATSVFTDPLAWEAAVLNELGDRWLEQAPRGESSEAIDVAGPLSTAMSYCVAGATWAATSQLASGDGPQRSFSKTDWETQVATASAESERTAQVIAQSGADADYVRWNEAFGRTSATAATAIGANDAVRLNGLQVQWYGNVQGHMLVSLTNGPS